MNPKVEAYVRGALWLVGSLACSAIGYFIVDDTPTWREFIVLTGPAMIGAIRSLMASSPRDVWDGKTERRQD